MNEGVDNILVSYDGWLGEAAKIYAAGHDMKDPMLSPIYGDVSGFPPTLLTTGTRDLFLSNTTRMHLKLRQAGIDADMIVFEGMSHAHYLMDPNAPETRFHFTELGNFSISIFNRGSCWLKGILGIFSSLSTSSAPAPAIYFEGSHPGFFDTIAPV